MTWDDVIRLFGQEDKDPSETLFRLSIEFPDFGPKDLLSVFDVLTEGAWGKNDVNPKAYGGGGWGAGIAKTLATFKQMYGMKTYYLSDIAFRNVFRIMFETSGWDDGILFQPDFFGELDSRVDKLRRSTRYHAGQKPHFVGRDLEPYEKLAEFGDRVCEKIRTRSGI